MKSLYSAWSTRRILKAREILAQTLSGTAMPTAATEEKETRQFYLPNNGVGSSAKAATGIVLPERSSSLEDANACKQKG